MDDNMRREKSGQDLDEALQLERVIARISQLFLSEHDYDTAFAHALKVLGETTGVSRVYIFENHAGNALCSNTVEWCNEGVTPMLDELQGISYEEVAYWKEVLEAGDLIRADSVHELPDEVVEMLEWQDIKSILAVPLTVMGRWHGFLGFDQCGEPRAWSDGAVSVLETAARLVSSAMERRSLEHQLVHTSHLSSVGALSSGVSHEFNNIHAGIMGLVELTLEAESLPPRVAAVMHRVLSLLHRGIDLTRKLNTLTGGAQRWGVVDLSTVVQNALTIMERHFSTFQISLSSSLQRTDCTVEGDSPELAQVVLNLLMNAVDAVSDQPQREIQITVDRREDEQVLLSIEDSGMGIPKERQSAIFEPFYTTWGKLEGGISEKTGLGLAICSRVVHRHQGAISLHSTVGKGSRFEVSLPWTPAVAEPAPPEEEEPRKVRKLRVGILDDDDDVRDVLSRLAATWGFDPTAFGTTEEALEACRTDSFGAFVVDLMLPGGGTNFIREISDPSLPKRPVVIVLTGLPPDEALKMLSGTEPDALLQKPLESFDQLRGLLASASLEV